MNKLAFAFVGLAALAGCADTVSTTTSALGNYNRVMDITNNTGVTMREFYASNTGQNRWGPDQLGNSVLPSGKYFTINFDDGTGACNYDFKAVFADGDVLTTSNVNVCAETGWVYQ